MENLGDKARRFSSEYSADWEDEAHAQRGEFLERFPVDLLGKMPLKDYAIGQNEGNTFCYWVEPGTRKWARITGATARKFGIYFGKEGSETDLRYRYSQKFSEGLASTGAETAVYKRVRKELLALITDGENRHFDGIDANPLSQMFKAKILSLYFPETYLAICSGERLLALASALGLDDKSLSKIQHDALAQKLNRKETAGWSDLKYAAFIYRVVLGSDQESGANAGDQDGDKKHRKVDFEKLMQIWRELGKKSEAYALEFERRRLRSTGLIKLADHIKDRTETPGYGYDFESFTAATQPRYIEVKTLTHISDVQSRFFVSENERQISTQGSTKANYFFYLVLYDSKREPYDVRVLRADELYKLASLEAQNYLVKLPRRAVDS